MDQKPKKTKPLDCQVVITQDDSPAKVAAWKALWAKLLAPEPERIAADQNIVPAGS